MSDYNLEDDEEDVDYSLIDTFDDDNDFEIIKNNKETDDEDDFLWASFNYKVLWGKTDRWDSGNYYPTEWEKFIKNG